MRDHRRRVRWLLWLVTGILAAALTAPAGAAVKPRLVLVLPFDTATLSADERWMGEGVAQIISLGLAQHPAFNQVDPARLPSLGHPDAWAGPAVLQAARNIRADAAIFGEITRTKAEVVIRPRLLEIKAGR